MIIFSTSESHLNHMCLALASIHSLNMIPTRVYEAGETKGPLGHLVQSYFTDEEAETTSSQGIFKAPFQFLGFSVSLYMWILFKFFWWIVCFSKCYLSSLRSCSQFSKNQKKKTHKETTTKKNRGLKSIQTKTILCTDLEKEPMVTRRGMPGVRDS